MLGFIESEYDPRDIEFIPENDINTEELPKEFNYSIYNDITIKNQGNTSTCVPTSLSTVLEVMEYPNIDIYDIYKRRPNSPEDGMQIRDALKIIKKDINDSFFQYYRLRSKFQIQYSLVSNGPCIFALPVKSNNLEFWKGSENLGGHAIVCIGFDNEGFILQNSWGYNWGNYGRTKLKYEDTNYIIEAWGII